MLIALQEGAEEREKVAETMSVRRHEIVNSHSDDIARMTALRASEETQRAEHHSWRLFVEEQQYTNTIIEQAGIDIRGNSTGSFNSADLDVDDEEGPESEFRLEFLRDLQALEEREAKSDVFLFSLTGEIKERMLRSKRTEPKTARKLTIKKNLYQACNEYTHVHFPTDESLPMVRGKA